MQLHPAAKCAGFSAAARHKTQASVWFCHTEEMTQLLRSAGCREWRRARVVVMVPSQTMGPEGWKRDAIAQRRGKNKNKNQAKSSYWCSHTWQPAPTPVLSPRSALGSYFNHQRDKLYEAVELTGVSAEGERCMLGLRPAETVAFWEAVSCRQGLWGMQYG